MRYATDGTSSDDFPSFLPSTSIRVSKKNDTARKIYSQSCCGVTHVIDDTSDFARTTPSVWVLFHAILNIYLSIYINVSIYRKYYECLIVRPPPPNNSMTPNSHHQPNAATTTTILLLTSSDVRRDATFLRQQLLLRLLLVASSSFVVTPEQVVLEPPEDDDNEDEVNRDATTTSIYIVPLTTLLLFRTATTTASVLLPPPPLPHPNQNHHHGSTTTTSPCISQTVWMVPPEWITTWQRHSFEAETTVNDHNVVTTIPLPSGTCRLILVSNTVDISTSTVRRQWRRQQLPQIPLGGMDNQENNDTDLHPTSHPKHHDDDDDHTMMEILLETLSDPPLPDRVLVDDPVVITTTPTPPPSKQQCQIE